LSLQRHEGIWRSGDMASLILSPYTRCRWMVSITLRLTYSRENCLTLPPLPPPNPHPRTHTMPNPLYAGLWCHWPRGLRRGSAAARLLGLRVRILPGSTNVSFLWLLCVLSGRGLCGRPIIRPEESYRLLRVSVWSWSLDNEALVHYGGGGNILVLFKIYLLKQWHFHSNTTYWWVFRCYFMFWGMIADMFSEILSNIKVSVFINKLFLMELWKEKTRLWQHRKGCWLSKRRSAYSELISEKNTRFYL